MDARLMIATLDELKDQERKAQEVLTAAQEKSKAFYVKIRSGLIVSDDVIFDFAFANFPDRYKEVAERLRDIENRLKGKNGELVLITASKPTFFPPPLLLVLEEDCLGFVRYGGELKGKSVLQSSHGWQASTHISFNPNANLFNSSYDLTFFIGDAEVITWFRENNSLPSLIAGAKMLDKADAVKEIEEEIAEKQRAAKERLATLYAERTALREKKVPFAMNFADLLDVIDKAQNQEEPEWLDLANKELQVWLVETDSQRRELTNAISEQYKVLNQLGVDGKECNDLLQKYPIYHQ